MGDIVLTLCFLKFLATFELCSQISASGLPVSKYRSANCMKNSVASSGTEFLFILKMFSWLVFSLNSAFVERGFL